MSHTIKAKNKLQTAFWYFLLILMAIVVLFPIWSAINISFLNDTEVASFPPKLAPSHLDFTNFKRAMEQAPEDRIASDARIDALRDRMIVQENPTYSRDYLDRKNAP